MARIKAVCFDLDDTLLDYDMAAYRHTVDCVCRELASVRQEVDPAMLLPRFWAINEQRWSTEGPDGGASRARDGYGFWRETWSMALATLGFNEPEVADHALALYVRFRHEHYRLFDDALEALSALRPDYKLAVITNGPTTTQRDKLQFLGLEPYFDVCAISGEVGFAKPDAGVFAHVLRGLGVSADEALHVGDSLSADVGGALAAGMTAVWLNRRGDRRAEGAVEPNHEVTTLKALLGLVSRQP